MKNTMQEYLQKFQKEHKRFYRYASVVGVLALITVLVVNWQLHRTGEAMSTDTDYACGLEEHEHSLKDGCYEVKEADLICGFTEGQIIDPVVAAAFDAAAGKTTAANTESSAAASSTGNAADISSGSGTVTDGTSGSNTGAGQDTSVDSANTGTSDNGNNTGDDPADTARIEELSKQIAELEAKEITTETEHHHTDACYEEKEVETEAAGTEKELTCSQSEHTHDDSCYTQEEGSEENTLTCGQEEHTHGDGCYTEKIIEAQTTTEKTLICGYEEGQMVPLSEEEVQKAKDEKAKKLEELRTQLAEAEAASQQAASSTNSDIDAAVSNDSSNASAETGTTPADSSSATTSAAPADGSSGAGSAAPADSSSGAGSTISADSSSAASSTAPAENSGAGSGENAGAATDTNTNTENAGTGSSASGSTETTDANAATSATTGTADANAATSATTGTVDANAATSATTGTADANAAVSASTGIGTVTTEQSSTGDTANDGRHHHTIQCYSTYTLLCQKTEHKHTSTCLIDKNADVETAADWEATIPGLSGDRAADLISVARSQLGYTESTRNYDEESHRGYTRYGEWYGNPYGDWGTFFAAFCLHYAQISDVPTNSGVQAWISNVKSADLWWDAGESDCIKEGDLVFFNDGNDHMGIISSISGSTISVIEGNRPNGDGGDSVQENSYSTSDGNIAGYCELPVENHDDQVKLMDSAYGADLSSYITSVSFQKIVNNTWQDATEFLTTDSVKGKIQFSNLPTSTLKNNNNKCYITLPDNIDCSIYNDGTTHYIYDSNNVVGTYTFEKDPQGRWNIVLSLYESYVQSAGENIHGEVDFEFKWNISDIPDGGKTETVQIGKWTGTIKITEADTDQAAFNIQKSDSTPSLESDGYIYIDYTVMLTVNGKNGFRGPIEMTDIFIGKGFEFVTKPGETVTITKSDGSAADATVTMKSSENTDSGLKAVLSIASSSADGKVAAGTYKITYRVKTSQKFGEYANLDTQVKNKATVSYKGKDYSSEEVWRKVRVSKIQKNSNVENKDGNIYVTYTVTVNKGTVVADLQKETRFWDYIPSALELVEDGVTITQYTADDKTMGMKIDYTYDEKTQQLSCTLPKGQFYYTIVYKTKVKDVSGIPVGGITVENTAHGEGGLEGEDTDKIIINNSELLKKEFISKEFSTADEKNIVLLKWKSTINVQNITSGLIYEDWGNDDKAYAVMNMTDAQREAVKLYDADGNVITSGYEIAPFSKTENGAEVGLFQIKFTQDIKGPVTIEYETTGDLSRYAIGETINYKNYFKFMDQTRSASTSIMYVLEDHDIIWKHKGNNEDNHVNHGTVSLNPGENTLTWYVTVNNKKKDALKNIDLVITDVIKDGMTFVDGSLVVNVQEWKDWKDITGGVGYSYQDGKLVIKIPAALNTGKIDISYKTKLPDDFIKGGDSTKDFSNTAEIEYDGNKQSSSYTQTVTRTVVQKKCVSYDKDLRILTYEIALNTEGSTLNGGNPLTVTDTIKAGTLQPYMKLESLTLCSASKVTDANGNASYSAGTVIQNMTADDADPSQEGHYHFDDATGTFKAIVPDGKAYVLVAKYSINYNFAVNTEVTNEVTVYGQREWKGEDCKKTLEYSTSAIVYTDKDTLTIWKRDKSQHSTLLANAVFKLEEYDESTGKWVDAGSVTSRAQSDTEAAAVSNTSSTLTTQESGRISTTIKRKTLYKLTEIAAPDSYVLDPTPTYFIACAEGDEYSLPDTIGGDSSYSKQGVTVYHLTPITQTKDETTGKVTVTGYGNIDIDRFNERDRTKVSTGELSVQKIWMDSNGNKISTYTDLEKQPKITVTLTKHTPEMYKITVNGTNSSQCIIEVPKVANSTVRLSGYSASTSDNGTITYDGGKTVITNITGDISLEMQWQDVSGTYAQTYVWKEVPNAASLSRTQATIISTVELSNANDWYYLWKDLEAEEYISYTLTEESVEGYKATYQLNKKDLEEGKEFTLGTSGDYITITNSPDSKLYVLPKTGGSGVMPIYLTGGMLTAGAAGLWTAKRRRRREQ